MTDMCVRCGELQAVHTHHRKLRSQGGDDSPANLVRLCLPCHDWCHRNPAAAYADGWMVHSWDDPASVGVTARYVGQGEHDEGHLVKPGETCPTCKRRVNHRKKKDSPTTKVFGYRVPVDDAETHEELLEAAALEIDPKFTERPHWKWALVNYAIAVVLQGGRLEERGA